MGPSRGRPALTDRILQIIVDAIDDINTMREEKIPTDNVLDLCLYGNDGIFESMYLVAFLSQVEEILEDEFEVEVTLASEKAVSLRVSPFSSVRRLIAFIEEELQLVGADAA
ncbi:hypothetical protein E4198_08565 [Streptomyces sp. RKND-216]|nr:hypothetical protein E4198_08565 [Streptomyces sp. RKND-216]